jgi:hypothetical protein
VVAGSNPAGVAKIIKGLGVGMVSNRSPNSIVGNVLGNRELLVASDAARNVTPVAFSLSMGEQAETTEKLGSTAA